ncbi:hypothetical protein ACVMFA_007236 [Bradyrhizobium liaoningense]
MDRRLTSKNSHRAGKAKDPRKGQARVTEEKKWTRFAKRSPNTHKFLDDVRSRAAGFQSRSQYGIAEFTRELYEYALKLKKARRLNRTLRKINKAARVRHGANRMFGYVKRASVSGWKVRRVSFTARILDEAIRVGTPLEEIEQFRRSYPSRKSRSKPERQSAASPRLPLFAPRILN